MPIEPDSVENSIQMVPIVALGFGAEGVARGVYFWSMEVVGRAEKVIFLRLQEGLLGISQRLRKITSSVIF